MTTSTRIRHQILPSSGPQRENLRQKGQFWTPQWVAEAMVSYALGNESQNLFDPAVGEGAFFRAAKRYASRVGRELVLAGAELDPSAIQKALESGLEEQDIASVTIGDFITDSLGESESWAKWRNGDFQGKKFKAIVGNPPYLRHHRITAERKSFLQNFVVALTGSSLDQRAGFHVYFLLCALTRLEVGGRLAFIMPADTVEGVFATKLWNWITKNYRLDAVVTFESTATPFPGVDTNALIFLIEKALPLPTFSWIRCSEPENSDLLTVLGGQGFPSFGSVTTIQRTVTEGLETGLSRPPGLKHEGLILGDIARVTRGIATGHNDFFFMTRQRADELQIPDEFLIPAIGRTRDLVGNASVISAETLEELDNIGRPTLLFSPDGRPMEEFPEAVRRYLQEGERQGVHLKTLIATRNPWYKMEVRKPPLYLFAYLGRRSVRFVKNRAGIVPLTGFLCVYPRTDDPSLIDYLEKIVGEPATVENLSRVGKSYGDGAIKVEPRSLEKLPLPTLGFEAPELLQFISLNSAPCLPL